MAKLREPTNICVECREPYWVAPYRRSKSKFCSFQCGGRFRAKQSLNTGAKDYMRGNKLRQGLRPASAFTSEQVRGAAHICWQEGLSLTCAHCGNGFKQKPWLVRQNGTAKFCSRRCFEVSACFVGENSPSYVGGPTTYRGKGWPTVRAVVVAEQEGRCDRCDRFVGPSLPVHHRVPFREFATSEEANQRGNLVGLCQSCHMKLEALTRKHRLSGQLDSFVQEAML